MDPTHSVAIESARKPALSTQTGSRKLGLPLLTGVVIASMIGGGAFSLPQSMAHGAGLAAVIIAWVITLCGMFFLSNTFRTLADKRPELKAGIYSYAKEGFGSLAGFEMAWGYWLSAAFGNVAFAVLIMQTIGYFFPIFKSGNNWPSLFGASALIWIMNFVVLSGVKRAAILNVISSVLNVGTISVALCAMAVAVRAGGAGIPVVTGASGRYRGVEAVIDKDRSAALLAREIEADLFVIATDVRGLYLDWGTVSQRPVRRASPQALGKLAFAAGSMGPKVEAACEFAVRTRNRAVIGSLDDIGKMVAGTAGTSILLDQAQLEEGPGDIDVGSHETPEPIS